MFVEKEKIEVDLTAYELINLFKENICTHSPVLNSKSVNIAKTDRIFMGEVNNEKIIFWEKSDKKRVVMPVFSADIEQKGEGKSALYLKIALPFYNRIMLDFWFLFVGIFCAVNLSVLPFLRNKLLFSVNFLSGAVFWFLSFFILKRVFKKRVKSVILKIKKLSEQ